MDERTIRETKVRDSASIARDAIFIYLSLLLSFRRRDYAWWSDGI